MLTSIASPTDESQMSHIQPSTLESACRPMAFKEDSGKDQDHTAGVSRAKRTTEANIAI